MAWQNRHTVVAGMADSSARGWDMRSGRCSQKMSLNKDRGGEVLVWAVPWPTRHKRTLVLKWDKSRVLKESVERI